MNAKHQRRRSSLTSIKEFGINHPLTPPVGRATVLYGTIADLIAEYDQHGGDQFHGRGTFQSGATERRLLAKELRETLGQIGQTARALNPNQFPGTANLFTLPSTNSYQALLDAARGILEAVTPVKQQFVDRAFEPDFDTELAAKIAEFETATQRKYRGLQEQSEGTVGLDAASRRALETIRELDAIVSKHLANSDPDLLPVWKRARRPQRNPQPDQAPEAPASGATPPATT